MAFEPLTVLESLTTEDLLTELKRRSSCSVFIALNLPDDEGLTIVATGPLNAIVTCLETAKLILIKESLS